MPIRKPKTFDVDGYTVTVDAADWVRVRPLVPRIRAVPIAANAPVFVVNHGTTERPAWQSLAGVIMNAPGTYWVLRDRTDPGDHRRANLVRA
jgi:hypothetical protein